MKKILITEAIHEKGIERLEREAQVTIKEGLNEEGLEECIGEYDALIIRSRTEVTPGIIQRGKKLKVIGRAGVGVDNIDLETATRRGIVVLNAPRSNTIAAAEHTIALMLSLARNIPQAHRSLQKREWKKKEFLGVELNNKTLGIIGLGQIGALVARRVQAFGMKSIAFDPYINREKAQKIGVTLKDLDQVLKESDFLTIHTPKNNKTYHLIGLHEIKRMKRGVRLINCARGGILDEGALFEALKEGILAGAALDVFEEEPEGFKRFAQLKNVILTPHLGASTEEAQKNVALHIAREVKKILKKEVSSCAVNLPLPPQEDYENVREYLPLAFQMGKLYQQIRNGSQNRIQILYQGPMASNTTTLLTNTILQGLLSGTIHEYVNQINAPLLAKERGILVTESKKSCSENYNHLISLKVEEEEGPFTISGTLFGREEPRIVHLGQYTIDLMLTENMLLIKHRDRPGMIGQVGSILGAKGINIAGMRVGRDRVGGNAIMVLQLDSPLPKELLNHLQAIDYVEEARSIKL